MATYDYILTGMEPETTFHGAALSDADAWREAIMFMSEMLRENPIREGGAFCLQLIVKDGDREICRIGAAAQG